MLALKVSLIVRSASLWLYRALPKIRETHPNFCIYMPVLIAIPRKVKIKTCFIGLGLSILTTTSLFLPAPAISEPTAAKIIVAQSPVERKRIAVLDFDLASTKV